MPRKPSKIKAGTKTVHISFLLDADVARRVDEEAERMTKEDPYRRVTSRTDALRSLISDGLTYRAERRK
jgi:hypothetical protein